MMATAWSKSEHLGYVRIVHLVVVQWPPVPPEKLEFLDTRRRVTATGQLACTCMGIHLTSNDSGNYKSTLPPGTGSKRVAICWVDDRNTRQWKIRRERAHTDTDDIIILSFLSYLYLSSLIPSTPFLNSISSSFLFSFPLLLAFFSCLHIPPSYRCFPFSR